ncbi:hypothetical protein F5148DRAFT_1151693 [Russula earlei]|uniref:Uncharacterized protein n=1 Tax=Russula earlei TaxID=71964 RepID=A0ACC0TZ99_9AGAM|nr:hypothetical protein F5148DRAFT_1151693 [Russula earlei]
MPKRTFTQLDPSSPSSSPSKRFHTATPASRSIASSLFSTPYTPSVYSVPADSPTNPLGLKRRVNNLTPPKATPFSKHIALRFQLVTTSAPDAPPSPPKPSLWKDTPSPRSSPSAKAVRSKNPEAAQYAREGTYRIVQAPLSYTFRHLYALILFLFSGDPAAQRAGPGQSQGHLFAVYHGLSIRAPGEIARGRVRVKLSHARDPYYSSRSLADLIAAADAQGQGEEDLEDEEEDASWRWEGEDDFTLGHVWDVRARDPKRGIVYHHNDTTAVHVTLNAQRVPHRKGVGNMPFVFRAYGHLYLDPLRPRTPPSSPTHLPRPAPAHPARPRIFPSYRCRGRTDTRIAASANKRPLDGPGDTDVDVAFSSSDEDDFDGGLNTREWNRTGAFPRFLSIVRANASSSSTSSTSSSPSPSPSAPPSPSSPVRTSFSSSPTRARRGMRRAATMPYGNAGDATSSASAVSLSLPSAARSLPSLTPAPARARTRYRVARAARRLLGLAERGLESAAAEEADVVDGRVQGRSKKAGGGNSTRGNGRKEKALRSEKEKDAAVAGKSRQKTKTVAGDAEPVVWNPFAHLKDAGLQD